MLDAWLSSLAAVDHPTCPLRLEQENGLSEGKSEFLSFPPEMAAEQFTLMDAVSLTRPADPPSASRPVSSELIPHIFSNPGALQESGALSLPRLHLVSAGQEGEGAPGAQHPGHRLPVQQGHQLCHCHLPRGQDAEAPAEGQSGGAMGRSRPGT